MNGIVHNCSHPDDNNIHFHLEEQQIFQDIFNYVDKLFYLIKPQRLFFLAVDGVAPRAKMNQQRSRRFRSAREAEQLEAKAAQRGERREHERFDSNCITPGTEFMPGVDVVRAALHGILGRNMDADAAFLEMLFGDTGYGAKIDGRGHRDLAAQLVALLQLIGTGQGQLGVQWTAVR